MRRIVPVKAKVKKSKNILLALTCHKDYFVYLDETINSIDKGCNFIKYLFLDNEDINKKFTDWTNVVVKGKPGPNKLRNKAIEVALQLGCDWIVYWDADNKMPSKFGSVVLEKTATAENDVGVFYNATGRDYHKIKYLAEANWIDTAGAWRVSALVQAGGWNERLNGFDDWNIALKINNLGFSSKPLDVYVEHKLHGKNRGKTKAKLDTIYLVRSLAVVTLWSGNVENMVEIVKYIEKEDWPENTHFYWLDNSNDENFSHLLQFRALDLINKGFTITIKRDTRKADFKFHNDISRHTHVSYLYNSVISKITENLTLLHEDDVIPKVGYYKIIANSLLPLYKIAGISAKYRSRPSPTLACASMSPVTWSGNPSYDSVKDKIEVGMTGGGYTLYLTHVIKRCLPFVCKRNSVGALQGWDGNLGSSINKLGYKLILHGGLPCEHRCKEVINYCNRHNLKIA